MNINEYVDTSISKIKGKRERYFVALELKNHIEDRVEYYTDCGYDYDTAVDKAIDRMGSAEELVESLSKLHNSSRYAKMSKVLSYIFLFGSVLGMIITVLCFLYQIDLGYRPSSILICVASVIVYTICAFAFYYAHISEDNNTLSINGVVNIFSFIFAPFTFGPTGYSILSLFFEFPHYISMAKQNGEFDYNFFYYPFQETIFTPIDTHDISQTVLYILMCSFALVPLVCGIISLKSAKQLEKYEFEPTDKVKSKRIKRFSKLMIVISIVSALSLGTEIAVVGAYSLEQKVKINNSFEEEFVDAWDLIDSIKLPITIEDARKTAYDKSMSIDESESEFGVVIMKGYYNYEIYLSESDNYKDDYKYKGVFDEVHMIRTSDNNISADQLKLYYKYEKGTSLEKITNDIGRENISDCCKFANGNVIYHISDSDKTCSLTLKFENNKLFESDLVDWRQ